MLKKSFSLILIIAVMLTSLCFSVSSESILAGDVNSDGSVNSDDARTILRMAVGLDAITPETKIIANTDGEDGITSGDARIALRMAVGLEELKYINADDTDESYFEVHFIDVGQADCSLIICDDSAMLIDGGNVADSSLVVSYLLSENIIELDYVICTHAHEDHVGGLNGPLNKFTVTNEIIAPATGADSKCYQDFLDAVQKQGKTVFVPDAGYTFSLGSSTVEILGPITEDHEDINDTSVVSRITYGETSFLFTGDAEREAEADILEAGYDISADVLKVGHHGSENSSTYPFLREVMPEYAVISVGENNSYGHPTEEALSRLTQCGATVLRTDILGHIIVKSDGENIEFETEKNNGSEILPDTESTTKPTEAETTEPEATEPESETSAPLPSHYIGNSNPSSMKFHLPDCSSLPKEENRVYFATRDAAIANGYSPCKRCDP